MYLAKLNDDNVVVELKSVLSMIDDGKHVIIESMDDDLMWRKYENGQWSEKKFLPPEPTPEPTIEEQILFENKYQTLLIEMSTLGGM